ncbi:hypothetical protein [Luteitalea sp.]|uniref:hypothetical protein n=1 Tax=Luteitalea sp. TaxID=2004800 RepID=UPI0025C0F953|nr:hypothetical protein [Luteitalea sp.]
MRHCVIAGLAASALLITCPITVLSQTTAGAIAASAQRLRTEALEVTHLLRASRPDFVAVNGKADALQSHAKALTQSLESFEASVGTLAARQASALDRARAAGATLAIILSNKASILSDGDASGRRRSLLRAKAEAVAKRADIVATEMTRVGA